MSDDVSKQARESSSSFAGALKQRDLNEAGSQLISLILNEGMNGRGPFKSAATLADELGAAALGDHEAAVARAIAMHVRNVGVSGFLGGLGGLATLPVSIPADVTVFYVQAARMVATIAHLRGYDPASEEVRSAVAFSLVGVLGTETLGKMGVNVAQKAGVAALKKLPGSVLTKINQRVGFRLVTKFGEKGAVNLVKAVPFVASGVGATLNVAGMRTIASYAKRNFPPLDGVVAEPAVVDPNP